MGAAGDDVLFGGRGDDTIVGGGGNDIILADGDNAGYATHVGVSAWASGGSAQDPNAWLRMRVHAARVGVTAGNRTGYRAVANEGIPLPWPKQTSQNGQAANYPCWMQTA